MSHRNGQRGITLVELLVATSITALLVGGLTAAILMVMSASQRGSDQTTALHDIRNAAYWITTDSEMASRTDLVDGAVAVDSVALQWTDGDGNSYSSSYWLSDTKLMRQDNNATRAVAWHVTSVDFSISGDLLTFSLESSPPGRYRVSKTTTGKAYLRPDR